MSDDVIISVEHLSKRYTLGQIGTTTLRESAERLWHRLRGRDPDLCMASVGEYGGKRASEYGSRGAAEPNELWALRDVSFEVKRGQVLGIIGRNGAGKSTLLKVLSRITDPTSGRAVLRGRVASLLEVGAGFHPELTGRENVYLNGAILGMKKAEIDGKFDEIVAFAEMERFIDTPVKRYSSGMYVRLAFAVAAHLEPEILLVDEVLAVGDAAFQKKCLGKIGMVVQEGRTVLFVSHNMHAMRSLCPEAILLEGGRVAFQGGAEETAYKYMACSAAGYPVSVETEDLTRPSELANSPMRIVRLRLASADTHATVFCDEPFTISIWYRVHQPIVDAVFGVVVYTIENIRLFEVRSHESLGILTRLEPGEHSIQVTIPKLPLNPGVFTVHVGARNATRGLDYLPGILAFNVQQRRAVKSLWLEQTAGMFRVSSQWCHMSS